jgi:hypothetical protein
VSNGDQPAEPAQLDLLCLGESGQGLGVLLQLQRLAST